MTQKEITSWLIRAKKQKLTLGRSIHRVNVAANAFLEPGFSFCWLACHELEPAQ